jgi:hypothetical protein
MDQIIDFLIQRANSIRPLFAIISVNRGLTLERYWGGKWIGIKGQELTLVVNLAITRMLYFMAWRCRDPLARQAIKNMQRAGKENFYAGKTLPKVAEWIVYKEEGGIYQGSFVREEKRLHDVKFDFDCVTSIAKIKATRRGLDGLREQLCEDLNVT